MALPETHPNQMTFWEHLQELRVRLVRSLAAVIVGFAVTYAYRFRIWDFVKKPLTLALKLHSDPATQAAQAIQPFAFTDLTEPFFSLMRLSLWAAALLVAPVLFYQLWAFIRPGLLPRERRMVLPFVVITTGVFLAGCWFAHTQAFAFLCDILFQEARLANLRPNLHLADYLDLYLSTVGLTGLMFELPVVFFFLARFRLVTAKWMLKYWRHATIAILVFSAFFTPGDVIATTVFFSVVLLGLYLVSVLVVWVAQPKPIAPKPDQPEI